MNDKQRFNDFMAELQALLAKYNASVNFTYDGDAHGIYDERTFIDFGDETQMSTYDTWLSQRNTTPKAIREDWY